ncbi:MAG: hypothetical protein JWR44_835 [Hymenobacter sp.]|jgi:hypothetical protein|nr:hypothetical protein [Hymenobacter sp.]
MQLMYPWFLVGLLAVAVPVVIHLLQLRRPQRLLFTNTAFIKEVELITTKHRRLQELLVLLTRILAVAALVFVFCQPYIQAKQNGGELDALGRRVFVDNSFSMQLHGAAGSSLLGQAVEEARNLGHNAPIGERFSLINNGSAWLAPKAYQAKLEEVRLNSHSDFSKSKGGLAEEADKNPLYVFSDFQKKQFDAKWLDEFGAKRSVVLVPVVGVATGNIYVDSVWLDDAFVRVRTNTTLHVRLRNGGGLAARDCPVKVFLGSRQVAAFRVTVEPGQSVTSVVQVQTEDASLAEGQVVTEDAPVTFDNTYYFTLQPAAAIRVLEIGNEPVAQQLYGNEPLFTYSFAKPQRVDYGTLRLSNMVLLHELEAVDAGLRAGLQAVVRAGGSVVVVPSAQFAAHDSYQQLFKALGLGAVQWEAKSATPELREVAMPAGQEPFFRDVFGAQQRLPTMPRVAPVLRWPRTGREILRLRDGESYLANFASGRGKVYVFSAPFAKEYSDFVAHALFVPVMYRLAMLSFRSEQLPAYPLTQAAVTLQLPAGADNGTGVASAEASFRFVKDSLTLIPAQRVVGQEARLELPTGMDVPGFYQVQRHGKVLTTLAFNQDKRESELAAYSAAELRGMIGANRPNIRVVEDGVGGSGLAKLQAEQTSQPLWRYFLAFALVCLLAEALLVRFGARRSKAGLPVTVA